MARCVQVRFVRTVDSSEVADSLKKQGLRATRSQGSEGGHVCFSVLPKAGQDLEKLMDELKTHF